MSYKQRCSFGQRAFNPLHSNVTLNGKNHAQQYNTHVVVWSCLASIIASKMKFRFKVAALLFMAWFILIFVYQLRKHVLSLITNMRQERFAGDAYKELHKNIGKRRRKKILMYTTLFGRMPWRQVPYDYKFTDDDGRPCLVSDCDVTYNKSQLSTSDLVVFYGRDLPSIEHMKFMSKNKHRPHQNWVFFMHESPVFSYFNAKSLNGMFNLTASYRSDSDILVTYWSYDPLENGDPRPKLMQNFAEGI